MRLALWNGQGVRLRNCVCFFATGEGLSWPTSPTYIILGPQRGAEKVVEAEEARKFTGCS